ncbi:TPA: hypothetical protein ACSPZZ_004436 [Aeromonas hydrophila]
MKQNAIYVGLSRTKSKIDIESRISTPFKIKGKDARQFISILNDEFLRVCNRIEEDDFYFEGGKGMDEVFDYGIYKKFLKWPYKSGIKNNSWMKRNHQQK